MARGDNRILITLSPGAQPMTRKSRKFIPQQRACWHCRTRKLNDPLERAVIVVSPLEISGIFGSEVSAQKQGSPLLFLLFFYVARERDVLRTSRQARLRFATQATRFYERTYTTSYPSRLPPFILLAQPSSKNSINASLVPCARPINIRRAFRHSLPTLDAIYLQYNEDQPEHRWTR